MAFFGGGGGAAPADMVGATSSAAGTAGLVPAPAAGEHNAALGGQGAFLPFLFRPKVTGWGGTRFFAPIGATNNNNGDGTITVGNASTRALLCPLLLPSGSVNNLGVFVVSSSANGTGYVAIYNSTNNGLPNNLVTSGSFSHVSGEANVAKTISISPSVSIKAGLYWGVFSSGIASPQMRSSGRGNSILAIFFGAEDGTGSFSTGGNNSSVYITTASAGAFPDPAGTFTYTNNGHPNIYVGFA
jgi:hypothetical protein